MAKSVLSVNNLIAELNQLGKSANVIESATDPGVKGEASKEVPSEKLIDPLAGQGTSLAVPAITPEEPAGEAKTDGKDVAVPSPEAFAVDGAAAKSASPIFSNINDLRNKLAAIATPVAPAVAPAAPAVDSTPAVPAVAPAAPEKSAAEYVPGDMLLKVAFSLMQTARGQSLVLEALEEAEGQKVATELVKAAADESADFLRHYTVERLKAAEQAEYAEKQAAAQRQADYEYAELTKNASAEELQAIENSSILLKRAAAIFADNPLASEACSLGFAAATKAAAAMEAGMPPEMAGGEAAGMPPEGGEEPPPSPEELAQALQVLVEQGILTPEQAEQLMGELMGGGDPGMEDPAMAQKAAAADEALSKIVALIS